MEFSIVRRPYVRYIGHGYEEQIEPGSRDASLHFDGAPLDQIAFYRPYTTTLIRLYLERQVLLPDRTIPGALLTWDSWSKSQQQGTRKVVADHNDPNAVNSIFSDIDVSAADLYDIFGFPSDDSSPDEKVVIALTFAAAPHTGILDSDILYRILIAPDRRFVRSAGADASLEGFLAYLATVKNKYLSVLKPSEVRVTVDRDNQAHIRFLNFSGGSFSAVVATKQSVTLRSPGRQPIKIFIGGRDDAFFYDLPVFFRSINYAPQFYHVPHTMPDVRELKIPKTFLELEGNDLFNYNLSQPEWGRGVKRELPSGPLIWNGNRFKKDPNGNFRFVYSGKDARAGQNCNAIILELPVAFLTDRPGEHRIVNAWGESWVLKASSKVETIPDDPLWIEHPHVLLNAFTLDDELTKIQAGRHGRSGFRRRRAERTRGRPSARREQFLAGTAFHQAPRSPRMGVRPVDHGAEASLCLRSRQFAGFHTSNLQACRRRLPARKKILFQELNMSDDSWNRKGLQIPLRRPHLHPQCELDRYGYDRHMAVRASTGGPGGDAFSVDLFGHERQHQRQAIRRRAIERPGPLEQRSDRTEDPSQSAEERQGVPA